MANDLALLADLLEGGNARPLVATSAPASTIYDVQYRVVVNACAFEIHGRPNTLSRKRIATNKLKLLQFVAIRPWLIPVIREWSASRGTTRQPLFTHRFRRGFLSDVVQDRVIDLLVASGALLRAGGDLVSGERVAALAELCTQIVDGNLFASEREVLQDLRSVRITNVMLEGW